MSLPEFEFKKVDFFPTVSELLNEPSVTRCPDCGQQFKNSSACRFHQLKTHTKFDELDDNPKCSNDRRVVRRNTEEPRFIKAFYCPHPECEDDDRWFDGIRYLRQHYKRSHSEKKFVCELCGHKLSLQKDYTYHIKTRCSVLKKKIKAAKREQELKKRNEMAAAIQASMNEKPRQESTQQPSSTSTNATSSTHTFVQPICFIVNPNNLHEVMEAVRKSFGGTISNGNVGGVSAAEVSTQMPFLDDDDVEEEEEEEEIDDDGPIIPMYATTATSTSFATQYDEPRLVTFCERGTMMNNDLEGGHVDDHDQEPLSYFSPPYGAEFGDMTPRQKMQQQFDYSSAPSTSSQQQQHQPQTRSFGTMFENVTTCNTGTSMMDESSYVSDFLRDIETQTPNYTVMQHGNDINSVPSNEWTWGNDL